MELFRFRNVRPVLSQPSDGLDVSALLDPPLEAAAMAEAVRGFAAAQAVPGQPGPQQKWLDKFSGELALRGDLVSPKDCAGLLPTDWRKQAGSPEWAALGHQLAQALMTAMAKEMPAQVVESLCRELLVYDFVGQLASDAARPAPQRRLQTAADVQAAVSWRHVILPAEFFPPRSSTPLLARRPGVTDLYVVRDEWNHYVAGELAAVINVLPGETFENQIRHSQKIDTLTSTTTQTTTSQSTEQDQTMSTSLSQASSQDASINIGVQGQVQTSSKFGFTTVNTSLGAQLQTSQTQSDSKASTTAYQTVQRAVKSVSQTVTTIQSQRTVIRDSSYADHKLQNTGDQVTVGMYRWLTEIHYVQLVRYPNRFVLEFEVPEPGAWLRWALTNAPTANWDNPDPGPFRFPGSAADISPADLTRANWTDYARLWRVRGLTPPPPDQVSLSVKLTLDPSQQGGSSQSDNRDNAWVELASDESLTVPPGYQAREWTAQVIAREYPSQAVIANAAPDVAPPPPGAGPPPPNTGFGASNVVVTVGGGLTSSQLLDNTNSGNATALRGYLTGMTDGDVGVAKGLDSGAIPVTVYAFDWLQGFSCVVNVTCHLTDQAWRQWQQATFDQLASAYQTLLNAFHQERDARDQQAGGLADLAAPPELNLARAAGELRRMVIQDLTGQEMSGENDVQTGPANPPPFGQDEPYVPAQPLADTEAIQFFEQAFEWENLVYICYPYYWARHSQWVTNATSASSDPVFDQFLNAGSARVVVPARPGFEDLVLYYIYTGQIWGGIQPPAPGDPDYLSVAQEIEALQKGAADGTPISPSWQVALPTTLLWAGTDQASLPSNPAPTIPPPRGS